MKLTMDLPMPFPKLAALALTAALALGFLLPTPTVHDAPDASLAAGEREPADRGLTL